jgi:hypothetical protein
MTHMNLIRLDRLIGDVMSRKAKADIKNKGTWPRDRSPRCRNGGACGWSPEEFISTDIRLPSGERTGRVWNETAPWGAVSTERMRAKAPSTSLFSSATVRVGDRLAICRRGSA